MKTYYLKIRDKFISAVREGNKKHEYRLASPDRLQIKVGDNLILISNQDKNEFVRTTVKGITIYKNWQEALQNNWQQDFKDLFSTLDEALKECYKFYPKNEVDAYGIMSLEIEPLYVDYCNVTILLDTNIIIKRESTNNASFEVSKLFNWFDKKSVKKYVHTLSLKELSTYGDAKAKDAILMKLNSYDVLPNFPISSDELFDYVTSLFANDENGKIDNALLQEVYNDNVGVMVTDDNLILQKAEMLYIRDKVLSSAELLEKFETKFPENIEYKMLAVELKKFEEVNLNDSFFDTLRADYDGQAFDRWFKKKGNEKAYVFESNEGLKGFLYLKLELESEPDYLKITPILAPKRRLKVGTFKIESSGFRLGERFLKIIFDNARKNDVEEIYVTLFEDKRDEVKNLKLLMEQWGFAKHGYKNSNGELVLVKSMKAYNQTKDPKFNYPILLQNSNKFFLPIRAQYHTDLFPDKILKNENMHLYEENLAHRYALEKIYLSGAFKITAKPGDIVMVYRMSDNIYKHYSSVVTGLALIQEIIPTTNVDECIAICKNRSIFSEEEIRKVHGQYHIVVKLLDFITFKKPIPLSKLRELNVFDYKSGPRPFTSISNEDYQIICDLGMEQP
ncbi:MAG: ASCH domain-containing protein [Clostridia bacterium]|nr:ASCH domain-containing protein [Clostridia bacterium]